MKHAFLLILAFSFISCQETVNTPPSTYELKQNYPNPFTDTTVVLYGVPSAGPSATGPWIRVVVNDRFNHTQAILVDTRNHPAGHDFKAVWNGRGANYQKAPAGIYYIELQQGNSYVLGRRVALKQ
jgi:hypothetical protein